MKSTLKQQYMLSVLHSQYHACWCSSNFRSQGISRNGIHPKAGMEYSISSIRRVNHCPIAFLLGNIKMYLFLNIEMAAAVEIIAHKDSGNGSSLVEVHEPWLIMKYIKTALLVFTGHFGHWHRTPNPTKCCLQNVCHFVDAAMRWQADHWPVASLTTAISVGLPRPERRRTADTILRYRLSSSSRVRARLSVISRMTGCRRDSSTRRCSSKKSAASWKICKLFKLYHDLHSCGNNLDKYSEI